jgi:hypothetical protein
MSADPQTFSSVSETGLACWGFGPFISSRRDRTKRRTQAETAVGFLTDGYIPGAVIAFVRWHEE